MVAVRVLEAGFARCLAPGMAGSVEVRSQSVAALSIQEVEVLSIRAVDLAYEEADPMV